MMSARVRLTGALAGVCAAWVALGAAHAEGPYVPFIGPTDDGSVRPTYRQAYNGFPPEQHNLIGQPVPPPAIDARPSYRQAKNAFPPPGGRFGGGFLEYVMTGGRPEPVAPGYDAPVYAQPSYTPRVYSPQVYAPALQEPNASRSLLPPGGLPDYTPGSPVYYGAPGYAPAEPAYAPIEAAPTTPQIDPLYMRQEVDYRGHERSGTIIIDTPDKFLYLVQPGGRALRYGIGVGRPGFTWAGVKTISRKAEWPAWTPPSEMVARRPDLPRHMAGGEGNPLGARAMYLGSSLYRIHGTNEPGTIGTNVSSGCIRMMNQDVIDLYGRVPVGTRVVVL